MHVPAEVRNLASFAELLSWAMGVFADHGGPNGLEAVRRANVKGASALPKLDGPYGQAPNHVHAQYFLRMGWAEANQEQFAHRPPSPEDVKSSLNPDAWRRGPKANEYFVGDGLTNFELFCRGARIPAEIQQWLKARYNDFKSEARFPGTFRAEDVLLAIQRTREQAGSAPSDLDMASAIGRVALQPVEPSASTSRRPRVVVAGTLDGLLALRDPVVQSLERIGLETIWAAEATREAILPLVDSAEHIVCVLVPQAPAAEDPPQLSSARDALERAHGRGLEPLVLTQLPGPAAPGTLDAPAITQLRDWAARLWGVRYFASPGELPGILMEALWNRQAGGGSAPAAPDAHELRPPRPPEPYVVQPYTLLGSRLVGRTEEIDALSRWFERGRSPILQVEAIGGVGKTALLWHWFNATRSECPEGGRMWWSFYEGDIKLDDLVSHAVAYFGHRSLADVRRMPSVDQEKELLRLLDGAQHLLVLDGLERATRAYATDDDAFVSDAELAVAPKELWDLGGANLEAQALSQTEQLRRVADLPLGSFLRKLAAIRGTRTLISTRNPVFDLEWRNGQPIVGVETLRIPGLTSAGAQALWQEVTGRTAGEDVLQILDSMENHPLFIRLLGAEVAQYRPAPGDFAAWRRGHPHFDPVAVLGNDPRKRHILEFAMSGLDDLQREVLAIVARAPGPLPFQLIATAPELDARTGLLPAGHEGIQKLGYVLKSLEDRALVGWDHLGNRYDLHPVVRGVVRSLTGYRAPATERPDATIYRGSDVGLPERTPSPSPSTYIDGLPTSLRLVDVLGLGGVTAEAIADRWSSNPRSTRAVIGAGADGLVELDLRTDGPHGLIGGATGSGKSELLQTVITSLALSNRPDEMNFLLVDFKGGAAFAHCNDLPHTLGLVTDLDPHLSERLITSLYAELQRRQKTLSRQNAANIDDYTASRSKDDEPMPRLVVVVDEFAPLASDLPELMRGLVDVARLGRSLGIHLLLATQRPAGAAKPDVKANTNLRISLRAADPADSGDIVGTKDAALLPRSAAGRGLLRVGAGEVLPFQTARVGGNADREEPFGGHPTDLEILVGTMREAAERTEIRAPRPPWLPELPDRVTLDEIATSFPGSLPADGYAVVPFGLVDLPDRQERRPALFRPRSAGHLEVIGSARSGRSSTLRVLAAALCRWLSPEDVHLYVVDLDSQLEGLGSFPHTGGIVGPYDTVGLRKLTGLVSKIVEDRRRQAADAGVDPSTWARWIREHRLPAIVIVADGLERLLYDDTPASHELLEEWRQILRNGPEAGVCVIMSLGPKATRSTLSLAGNARLVLRMPDTLDYVAMGLRRTSVPTHMVEGRAFNSMDQQLQIALLAPDPSAEAQLKALAMLVQEANDRWADVPQDRLPREVR